MKKQRKKPKLQIRNRRITPKNVNNLPNRGHTQIKSDMDILLDSVEYPKPPKKKRSKKNREGNFLSAWNRNTSNNPLKFQLLDEKSYEDMLQGNQSQKDPLEIQSNFNRSGGLKRKLKPKRAQSAKHRLGKKINLKQKLKKKNFKNPYLGIFPKKPRPSTAKPRISLLKRKNEKKNNFKYQKRPNSSYSHKNRIIKTQNRMDDVDEYHEEVYRKSHTAQYFSPGQRPYSSHVKHQKMRGGSGEINAKKNFYMKAFGNVSQSGVLKKYEPFYDSKNVNVNGSWEFGKSKIITSQEQRIMKQNKKKIEKLERIFNSEAEAIGVKNFLHMIDSQRNSGRKGTKSIMVRSYQQNPGVVDIKIPKYEPKTLLNQKGLKFESLEKYAQKNIINFRDTKRGKNKLKRKKKRNFYSRNILKRSKLKKRSFRGERFRTKGQRIQANKKFNFRSPEFVQSKLDKKKTLGHHFKEVNKRKKLLAEFNIKNPFIKNSTLEYERMLKKKDRVVWKKADRGNGDVDLGCFGVGDMRTFYKVEEIEDGSFTLRSEIVD